MVKGSDRIIRYFRERGLHNDIYTFEDSTHDSESAARALGVSLGQIAKTILFLVDGEPVVVVLSGEKRVDLKKVKKSVHGKKIRFAGEEAVKRLTSFEVGAVSPIGLPESVKIIVDRSLEEFEEIYPAAGEIHAMFRTSYRELLEITGAAEMDVSVG